MGEPRRSRGKARARPRGRPTRDQEAVEKTRDWIVEAAKRLFRIEGFGSVSMRRIALLAGCGTTTLYGYFPSKAHLLRHIWAEFFDEVFSKLDAARARRTGYATVKAMANAYLDYWFEHPDRFRMVFFNKDQAGEGDQFFVDSFNIPARLAPLAEAIRAGQAAGEVVKGDPDLILQTLLALLHGIALNLITIEEFGWASRAVLTETALRLLRP